MATQIPPTFQFSTIDYNTTFFPTNSLNYLTLAYMNNEYLKSKGIVISPAISTTFIGSLATNSSVFVTGYITFGLGSYIISYTNGLLSIGNSIPIIRPAGAIMLGNSITNNFSNSVCIGNGVTCISSSSINLGTSNKTIFSSTLNILDTVIATNSSYTFPLNNKALGYNTTSQDIISTYTTSTYTTIIENSSVPYGVILVDWNINFQFPSVTTYTYQNYFISETSSNTNTPLSNINAQHTDYSTFTTSSVVKTQNGSQFIYNNTSQSTILYLTMYIIYSGGSGITNITGNISYTRIA